MSLEKLYPYVASTYGPADLYYLPNAVSLATIWDGVPYVESAFPYSAVFAYLTAGIGWTYRLLFAGGGTFDPSGAGIESWVKAFNLPFGLADGILVYLIARGIGVAPRGGVAAGLLFTFNPPGLFSPSGWGPNHVINPLF